MKTTLETPSSLNAYDHHAINEIAAEGFGFNNAADMFADTLEHIQSADTIQQAKIDGETIGFALYRSCLWRTCN